MGSITCEKDTRPEGPNEPSSLGRASVALGVVALGLHLFGFGALAARFSSPVFLVFVLLAGAGLALLGLVFGLVSEVQQGRDAGPGCLGLFLNGLIVGLWLLTCLGVRLRADRRAPHELPHPTHDLQEFIR
jgi:hypothetical protein